MVVFGDINVDIFARVDTFAGLGGDYLVPALELHCGGVGANTALALARWGVRVRLLGATGRDWFSEFALGHLRRQRVDVSGVRNTSRALTGIMFTVIGREGERTFFGSRGANADFRASFLNPRWRRGMQALHLVGYDFLSRSAARAARHLLADARRRGMKVSLDVGLAPAGEIPRTILQVARRVDILFVSRGEATALTGERDTIRATRTLEGSGAGRVIVKLGDAGCLFRGNGRLRNAPAFPVAAADTTGCGDAFTGAYLRAWYAGWPAEEAALLANASGAAAAAVLGGGEGMPEPRQVLRRLSQHRLKSGWEQVRLSVLRRLKKEMSRAGAAR